MTLPGWRPHKLEHAKQSTSAIQIEKLWTSQGIVKLSSSIVPNFVVKYEGISFFVFVYNLVYNDCTIVWKTDWSPGEGFGKFDDFESRSFSFDKMLAPFLKQDQF